MDCTERNQLRQISIILENVKNISVKEKFINEEIIMDLGSILSYNEILLLTKYSYDDNLLYEYFYSLNDELSNKCLPYYWVDLINLQLIIFRHKQ